MFFRILHTKYLIILSFLIFPFTELTWSADAKEVTPPGMPFKLGFEFQEGSHLCPWALTNYNLQKVPYLTAFDKETSKPLWKLVIDSDDLEFVTEPFSHTELSFLEKAINGVVIACNDLQQLLHGQASIPFPKWIDQMKGSLAGKSFNLIVSEKFDLVKGQLLLLPPTDDESPTQEWKPIFMPQVTIQHPLEHTIPLYFGMFGFNFSRYISPFFASLPYLDSLIAAQEETNLKDFTALLNSYRKKISGLIFLHALTLVRMAPTQDTEDSWLLRETANDLRRSHQIDVKGKLPFMSRRAISVAIKDINLDGDTYETIFKRSMDKNSAYKKRTHNFHKLNYGEQFFDAETGYPLSLQDRFKPLFVPDFWKRNEQILINLLIQGVVSTAMIRNFRPDICIQGEETQLAATVLQQYLPTLANSVDFPTKRYIISSSADSPGIKCIPSSYDALSPPWFLNEENSMGRFKGALTSEEKSYGEAIMEVRAISNVQPWFLKRIGIEPQGVEDGVIVGGSFLCNPTSNLLIEVTALFNFLKIFSTQEDFFNNVNFGIANALCKFTSERS